MTPDVADLIIAYHDHVRLCEHHSESRCTAGLMAVAQLFAERIEAAEHLAFVAAVVAELDWLAKFSSGSDEATRVGALHSYWFAERIRQRAERRLVLIFTGIDSAPWAERFTVAAS